MRNQSQSFDPITILALDDEPRVLRALERIHLPPPMKMICTQTIAEARAIMEQKHISVALIDHNLPGALKGLDLLAELSRSQPQCFRILFTGEADFEFMVRAINQGHLDSFLAKPWSEENLVALLMQGTETARLRSRNDQLKDELKDRNRDLERLNTRLEKMVQERTQSLMDANAHLRTYQQQMVRLEAQAMLTQLVRGLAHELNNPLSVILGHTQRMIKLPAMEEDDRLRRHKIMQAEVQRCIDLVDRLRSFSVPHSESQRACSISDIVLRAMQRLEKRGLTAPEIRSDGDLPFIMAAADAMSRVIEQVLDNAVKSGAKTVFVHAKLAGDQVTILCGNDGATPTDDEINNAVRPFFTTRQDGSAGLGLCLASSLLREMGGTIALDRRPDGKQGALVVITAQVAGTSAVRRAIRRDSEDRVVLILEEDRLVADLIAHAIEEAKLTPLVCHTVAEAENNLQKTTLIGIIAGIERSSQTLEEFLTRMARDHALAPERVILASHTPQPPEVTALLMRFGWNHLAKPFLYQDLSTTVQALAV